MTAGNVDDQDNSTKRRRSSLEPPPKQRPAHRRRILIGCGVLAGLVVISCICVQIALQVISGRADSSPAWSPNGAQIAFISDRDGNQEIYVMPAPGAQAQARARGSGLTRLTRNRANEWSPDWSPDGTQIAFVSDRDGNREIYVMPATGAQVRADGSGPTRLTDNAGDDHWPAWSPDGTLVAFVSTRDGDEEIYVMPAPGAQAQVDAGGSGPTRLTYSRGWDASPVWSPDGTRIAFNSWRDGNAEIYVMPAPGAQVNADGSGLMRLTDNAVDDLHPAWSPDGAQIAFVSGSEGRRQVYLMPAPGVQAQVNADRSGRTQVTDKTTDHLHPVWSPDGTRIAFTSYSAVLGTPLLGAPDIYVINADGTELVQLTD